MIYLFSRRNALLLSLFLWTNSSFSMVFFVANPSPLEKTKQTGKTWDSAFESLNQAIEKAQPGDQIWVKSGSYTPSTSHDRKASFKLKPGLLVYGGFSGNETALEQRRPDKNQTILSGNIGTSGHRVENSFHVVIGANNARLDGFTIKGGHANGTGFDAMGGGILDIDASPKITHCYFTHNEAQLGGAMYNYHQASPTVQHTTFSDNHALKGGAVLNRDGANGTFVSDRFTHNYADYRGGAVFNDYGASPVFSNCQFIGNKTDGNGGAIYTDDVASQIGYTSPKIMHSLFEDNNAQLRGGAIANFNGASPMISDCKFINNHAGSMGSAIDNHIHVTATIQRCTFTSQSGSTHEKHAIHTDNSSSYGAPPTT